MQTLTELELPHLAMEELQFAADPFPHFAAARERHPWLARSVFGLVVTEYGAMRDLLGRNDSLQTGNDSIIKIMGAEDTEVGRFFDRNIFNQQGDTHRRLRDALAPIFTPRRANAIRPQVREVIDALLNEWAPRGEFDFQEFASYFPISVLSRMIGGPLDAIPRLRSSLETLGLFFAMDKRRMPQIEAAYAVIKDFVDGLVGERRFGARQQPEEDLLDLLLAAGAEGRLSHGEIVDLLIFLYSAGYDTSKGLLTLIMRQLIERPDIYERCAAEHEYCRKVAEEMLRFCGVSTSSRVTTKDIEYRGLALPEGTIMFFPVSVAGRDPGTFDDPDKFDPERPIDPEHRHIAFGRGAHVCLGQHLVRVQLQEGLNRITQRLQNPWLAGEVTWRPFPGIWGPRTLPIKFLNSPVQGHA